MSEDNQKIEEKDILDETVIVGTEADSVQLPIEPAKAVKVVQDTKSFDKRGRGKGSGRPFRGDRRDGRERVKPEFDTKIIQIRRVTRVTKGGKRMSFSVAVVSGDRKGRVGIGTGKSLDTSMAIDKATRNAKKYMFKVNHTPNMSIPHDVYAKFSSGRIIIKPAPNKGLVAGSAGRVVIQLAGLTDINAKILSGSKNQLNIAKATVSALKMLSAVKTNRLAKMSEPINVDESKKTGTV